MIVSVLLAFMAISGILGWVNIRGLSLLVEVPDEVYCGLATLVTLRLMNSKRYLPSFLLRTHLLEGAGQVTFVETRGKATCSFSHTFPERGVVNIPFAAVCSPFPVNFFVRCIPVRVNCRVAVFPSPLACPVGADVKGTLKNGTTPTPFGGYDGDVAKIGDYTGSEPLKLIHWRLSAKHESFKVKELSASSQEPVIVDVRLLPGNSIEDKLSRAVFLVNRLIRASRPVGLKVGDKVFKPALSRAHRLALLYELAVYGKD